jgi:hypothetical protein
MSAMQSSLTAGELQSLPPPIQALEATRIQRNQSQAAGWTGVVVSLE